MSSKYHPVKQLLTRGTLRELTAHCDALSDLEARILALLPGNLAAHTHLCNVSSTALVLSTHSSAWATRLRMMAPRYLTQFRTIQGLEHIRAIRIRTLPDAQATRSEQISAGIPARSPLSPRTRALLLSLAESEDSELGESYRRLAGLSD